MGGAESEGGDQSTASDSSSEGQSESERYDRYTLFSIPEECPLNLPLICLLCLFYSDYRVPFIMRHEAHKTMEKMYTL